MKDAAFQELLTSIRQAGRIRRGTLKPARVMTFRPADVKAVLDTLVNLAEAQPDNFSTSC